MIFLTILTLVLIIIIFISYYFFFKYIKSDKEKIKNKIIEENNLEIEQLYKEKEEKERRELDNQIKIINLEQERKIQQIVARIQQLEEKEKILVEQGQKLVDEKIANYEKLAITQFECQNEQNIRQLQQNFEEKRLEQEVEYNIFCEKLLEDKEKIAREILYLEQQLEDYRNKQEAAAKEIVRRRAIEENQSFYSIELSKESQDDIEILNSIRQKLNRRDFLDKIIYDTYIAKPANEMIKRVLEGKAPSGIYKITRLKTGEVYIGKSTDIKARWQQHIKTANNCGTIAHSTLHTTMEKDGISNFTFELLEVVPKDKLTEREKYWINFYKSKEYGLNMKEG